MPMKRHLYPKNWRTIATIIKYLAKWKCQQCDRPCLRPNQDWFTFCSDLLHEGSTWYEETFENIQNPTTGKWAIAERKGRFILTVAHLDQNPRNNQRENLKALCPTCHNRHDAPHRAKNAKRTRYENKHRGQLKLWNS